MPPGSAEASMVKFVLIVNVLLSVMVAPDRFRAKVMIAPLVALVRAERKVPGPLSAVLVTTCAEAVASPAKNNIRKAGRKMPGTPRKNAKQ